MLNIVASSILYPEIIIRSAVSITGNLITSVNYLSTISKSDLELQDLLSIVEDISIIKTFIEEKQHSSKNSKTLQMCIENLSQTLTQLEKNINSITEKIHNHNEKWFGRFRYYDISSEKAQLPLLIRQMKHKFEMLISISSTLK